MNTRQRLLVQRIAAFVGADEERYMRLIGASDFEASVAMWLTTDDTVAMLLADDRPAVNLPMRRITGRGPTRGD